MLALTCHPSSFILYPLSLIFSPFPLLGHIVSTTTSVSSFIPSKDTLFALSLFPYLGFLWFLTRSKQAPRLVLIGFYATLVFVAITIPVGIYARVAYGQALANVDFLHGGAEFFLTLANVLLVLGFRQAIQSCQESLKDAK
jgi:hypothetical protein